MEESNVGLVKIKPLLCKTDPKLIEEIAKKRAILLGRVKEMMMNNRWTVKQFADLIGKTTQYVHHLLKPEVKPFGIETRINHCYPYPTSNDEGPKFVVRDESSEEFLKDSLKSK